MKYMQSVWSILHFKIIVGHLILIMTILIMGYILIYERIQFKEIESTNTDIQQIRKQIYTIHGEIISLSMSAESVICWDEQDKEDYHFKHNSLDSALQRIHLAYPGFISSRQIDTLHHLLQAKERHLFQILDVLKKQDQTDSLIIHQLPYLTHHISHTPKEAPSKKKFLGIFSKKEKKSTMQPAAFQELYVLNEKLNRRLHVREQRLMLHTDSLTEQNRLLNQKFTQLINELDSQAYNAFQKKEERMASMRESSLHMIAYVLVISIIFLIVFNILIFKEIKAQKKIKQILESSNTRNESLLLAQDNLMITLTHDLRAPLNVIHGYAGLIRNRKGSREDRENAELISQSAEEMLQLISRLLEHFRIDKGKEDIRQTAFPLSVLTEQIRKNYENEARRKYLDLQLVCKCPEMIIVCDRMRLQEIINNLLTNAFKFTSEGFIRIELLHESDILHVKVQDSGCGMSEEEQETIFEMFKRLENSVRKEGYGIGLSITAAQVKLLGGHIHVGSTPGKGSTFTVSIPAIRVESEFNTTEQSVSSAYYPPVRILAIDDDPIQLRYLTDLMEDTPVRCDTCTSVKEMFGLLQKEWFHLILTDIQMHPVSGIDLMRLLRESNLSQSGDIPVIAVTARTDRSLDTYLKHGFAGCLNKPFSQKELLETIYRNIPEENIRYRTDFSILLAKEKHPAEMLELFIQQTREQVELLKKHLEKDDAVKTAAIIHCIASYWTCIRADLNKTELEALAMMRTEHIPEEYKPVVEKIVRIGEELIHDATTLYQTYGKEKNIDSGR